MLLTLIILEKCLFFLHKVDLSVCVCVCVWVMKKMMLSQTKKKILPISVNADILEYNSSHVHYYYHHNHHYYQLVISCDSFNCMLFFSPEKKYR